MLTQAHASRFWLILVCGFGCLLEVANIGHADDVVCSVKGKEVTRSGTVKFENDKLLILETPDGFWWRLPKAEIKQVVMKEAPPFIKPNELAKEVQEKLGDTGRVRAKVAPNVIVLLVLEADLPAQYDAGVDKVLTETAKAYDRTADAVADFAKRYKLSVKKPTLPAIVVLYESDGMADKRHTADWELSAGVTTLLSEGWYDPHRNVVSFSMPKLFGWHGEITTTLVWQQLFHTGILKRHAPIPLWWLQAVAAGFSTTGNKVEANHLKLSSVTFPELKNGLIEEEGYDWTQMVTDYDYFVKEDNFTFEKFRDRSWGLHWYLLNKNKAGYAKYWKSMTDLSPLEEYSTERNKADFKKAFGKDPGEIKPLFQKAFEVAAKTPPPDLDPDDAFWYWKAEFGSIKMNWLDEAVENGEVRMDGTLTNISPLRPRSFCIGFKTNRDKGAVWFVEKLEPLKSIELKVKRAEDPPLGQLKKNVKKAVPAPGAANVHEVDEVWIQSARVDSLEAEKWKKGELPNGDREE